MTISALCYHSPGIGLHDFPKTYQQNKIMIKFHFMENRIIRVYQIKFEIYGDPRNLAFLSNIFCNKVNIFSAYENWVTETK